MSEDTIRTTVVLPVETVEKMRELIPARKRSKFIAEAVELHLRQIAYRQGRELSFGAWKDEDHPDLKTQSDMRRYINELRDRDQWRHSAEKERQ